MRLFDFHSGLLSPGRAGAKVTKVIPERSKPVPIPGGPAGTKTNAGSVDCLGDCRGRLLQFLGQKSAEHPRSGSNTERAAEAQAGEAAKNLRMSLI